MAALAVSVTKSGRLHVARVEIAGEMDAPLTAVAQRIADAFDESRGGGLGHALLHLAVRELDAPLGLELAFAREIAKEYLTRLCHAAAGESDPLATGWKPISARSAEEWAFEAMKAPPMKGLEYLTADALALWWTDIDAAAQRAAENHPGGLQGYLREASPLWRMIGRVTFHLAENKKNPERPFAFLATYARRVSAQARVQHQPLGAALREYGGAQDKGRLIALLTPVERAAERSPWIKALVERRDIFQAQSWSPADAYQFLRETPVMEESGLLVRVPDWWKAQRPPRPAVNVRIGESKKSALNLDALMDFHVTVALGDEELSAAELNALLSSSGGLVMLKGRWVELDKEKLQAALDHWKSAQAAARHGGVTFLEAMRMLSGVQLGDVPVAGPETLEADWSRITAGDWLGKTLARIRAAQQGTEGSAEPTGLCATLRPYQRTGVDWLTLLVQLGLGACLADDMGLGKTVQVLGLLMKLRSLPEPALRAAADARKSQPRPSLLTVPASLLGNWKAEIAKFAPDLCYRVAHPSETDEASWTAEKLPECELVITTYGMLARTESLRKAPWNLVILDEAQAIKNSGSRQTRAVKELATRGRIALTGTPVENRLSDLWSLFDFLNPGLLGSAAAFGKAVKRMEKGEAGGYGPLRMLVRPYLLRRLKTDKKVIADLPEKTEVRAFCTLTKRQAALYQEAVESLAREIKESEGIQRRGIVLAYLMRFKQICNHPAQWLGDGNYDAADSGKFARLGEICAELAERQERVLVFTQFREMSGPLADYLARIYGRPGLILHGQTPVAKRRDMVETFQAEDGPPFFVLSLKAGGTGLNLTAASQVIHFDRWWNPAVENQATDRAFRIGQKKNVLVHKFLCRGTLEERIDELIAAKENLSRELLGGGAEKLLTEMRDDELLRFVALDIHRAGELL